MSSFLGRLFGTEKAINNIVDKDDGLLVKAGSWFGNLHYTDEEKAEHNRDMREWGIRQLDALAPFKVTQRVLAFTTAGVWVFMIFNIVLAIWLSSDKTLQRLIEFALSQYVAWPTISVFGLYFTGGVVDAFKRRAAQVNK